MKNDAFISYSKLDKETADAICKALEAAQLRCWYAPRDIPSGADWDDSIMEALTNSKVMILVWSTQSDKSKHVKREVAIALDDVGITLIPFRVEEIGSSKLRYYLGNIHWLDAAAISVKESLQQLLSRVQDVVQQGTSAADAAAAQLQGRPTIGRESKQGKASERQPAEVVFSQDKPTGSEPTVYLS